MRRFVILLACLASLPAHAFTADPGGPVASHLIPLARPVPVPDIPFTDPQGGEHRLGDWKGKVVVAVMWATWCHVCQEELPVLDRLAERYRAQGIEIVPVALDQLDPMPKIRRFMQILEIRNLPSYSERSLKLASKVGVRFTPTTLIIDAQGKVIAGIVGEGPWDEPEFMAYLQAVRMADSSQDALGLLSPRE